MAPVKPMGVTNAPKGTKPGVTGFPQDYNDQPSPSQDLNPDAVTDPDALPEPQQNRQQQGTRKAAKAPRAPRKSRK